MARRMSIADQLTAHGRDGTVEAMDEDHRRLESGKFLLDIAKYILTAIVVTSFITERINMNIGLLGLAVGAAFAVVGIVVLPPKPSDKEER